jgi:hypothetical protein
VFETRSDDAIGNEAVAALMRAAGLQIDGGRLEELASLLDAARGAASRLDDAAERVPLADALGFDPAWPGEGNRP